MEGTTTERRSVLLEAIDTMAVLALAVLMTLEVLDRASSSVFLACNSALFLVLLAVFGARVVTGEFARLTTFWKVAEVVLLLVAVPTGGGGAGPLRLLRLVRLPLLGARRAKSMREQFVERGPLIVVASALATAYIGALFILEFERGRKAADYETLPDALWWAATTMTTVGYGDLAPQTQPGRIVGIALMIVGISLFSMVTALLSKWLMGGRPEDEPASKADIALLRDDVAALRMDVASPR